MSEKDVEIVVKVLKGLKERADKKSDEAKSEYFRGLYNGSSDAFETSISAIKSILLKKRLMKWRAGCGYS